MGGLFLAQVVMFGFTLWFGLYLVGRSAGKPGLRYAGFGLTAYAVGIAAASISRLAADAAIYTAGYSLITVLPAGFWFASAWSLLHGDGERRIASARIMPFIPVIAFAVSVVLIVGIGAQALVIIPLAFTVLALVWTWRSFRSGLPRPPLKVLLTATLFFGLGTASPLLPLDLWFNDLVLLAIGFDLLLLGYAIARLDAYDEGTAMLPDALRSLLAVGAVAGVIGGQTLLIASPLDGGRALLVFTILTTVITLMTWISPYQHVLDRLVFGDQRVTNERNTLTAIADALPRQDESLDLRRIDDAEFDRLTRRALSHMNDLGKLAASPLARLPLITERLRTERKTDTSLERAHALRALLHEQIIRLKPYSDDDFGTGDEWRYYNALYFPYVVGLKPYNVRLITEKDDPTAHAALEWFQTYVPERTLYNWQNAAAKLIAQHIREVEELA